MSYSKFEKDLYADIFEKAQTDHHFLITKGEYSGDFDALRSALAHFDKNGIVLIFYSDDSEVDFELSQEYCSNFINL